MPPLLWSGIIWNVNIPVRHLSYFMVSSSSSLAFQGHYSSGSGSCLSCHEDNSDFNFSAESSLKVSGEGSLSFPIGDERNS